MTREQLCKNVLDALANGEEPLGGQVSLRKLVDAAIAEFKRDNTDFDFDRDQLDAVMTICKMVRNNVDELKQLGKLGDEDLETLGNEQLGKLTLDGRVQAGRILFGRLGKQFTCSAKRRLGDSDAADECVAEMWIAFVIGKAVWERNRRLKRFLCGVLHKKCMNHRRGQYRRQPRTLSPAISYVRYEYHRAYGKAKKIDKLPSKDDYEALREQMDSKGSKRSFESAHDGQPSLCLILLHEREADNGHEFLRIEYDDLYHEHARFLTAPKTPEADVYGLDDQDAGKPIENVDNRDMIDSLTVKVAECLAAMNPQYREVIALRSCKLPEDWADLIKARRAPSVDDLTRVFDSSRQHKQVGKDLGISADKARTRYNHAMQALRKCLNEKGVSA